MNNMKHKLMALFTFLFISVVGGICWGYEQYGFVEYSDNDGAIDFTCTDQCYISLGQIGKIDLLQLNGSANGNGVLSYGFLMGDSVALINQDKILGNKTINEKFELYKFSDLKQIPSGSELIILVDGNVGGDIDIKASKAGLGERFNAGWESFWDMETYTPYSINLRYGVDILGISILKFGYIIFIIGAVIIIFGKGKKNKKLKNMFLLGVSIFLLIGIRNIITDTYILHQGITGFKQDMSYFDLGDYIPFTAEIRKELHLDSKNITKDDCKIYINSYQDRPFLSHWESFYLKPCERVFTGEMADFTIYYHKDIKTEDLNKQVLIHYNGNYLLQN